jgi:hypothetical protein
MNLPWDVQLCLKYRARKVGATTRQGRTPWVGQSPGPRPKRRIAPQVAGWGSASRDTRPRVFGRGDRLALRRAAAAAMSGGTLQALREGLPCMAPLETARLRSWPKSLPVVGSALVERTTLLPRNLEIKRDVNLEHHLFLF